MKKILLAVFTVLLLAVSIVPYAMNQKIDRVLSSHEGQRALVLVKSSTYTMRCLDKTLSISSIRPFLQFHILFSNDAVPHFLVAFLDDNMVNLEGTVSLDNLLPGEERSDGTYRILPYYEPLVLTEKYHWSFRRFDFVSNDFRHVDIHDFGMSYAELENCALHTSTGS